MSSCNAQRLDRSAGARVFGADIAGYEAVRMGYPPALYDAIRARLGGDAGAVLEIGPGTGLATRDIMARLHPSRLVAVEADARLAAHLEARLADPRVAVVADGFVEASLAGPFDLACSAAAFHWLDPVPAFAKLRRLLRPGATLALWWNSYRQPGEDDLADAIVPLLADVPLAPSEGAAGHYSLDVDLHRAAMTGAGFDRFEPFRFRRERELDAAGARALYASYSYVRALPAVRRERLLDAIADLVDTRFGGRARNVVLTALYLAIAPGAAQG
ncbi:class I SAM-dependent methyltransferase [Sphingopyxis panaciterrulae]|uniref:SAM-dependent methyltransferase n=1 Tax=Sphingopyxis panaciterrulae TaxID=462372 RepID=A0A7W9B428_9SPHN|nr:class I SAM-dependent methyltransferase [Sphingopyxis panaciterrulae]MBB5705924.1 SAM-dependent methyltransferase [Sphingopyxis panaciterrulae]